MSVVCASLSAQSFGKAKVYVEQNHKLKLVAASIDVQDSELVATTNGKDPHVLRIPYSDITELDYERSAHRRWKSAALVSPLFLLSKGKKHWIAVLRGDEETVFQLSKANYSKILAAVEAESGKKVKMIASRN